MERGIGSISNPDMGDNPGYHVPSRESQLTPPGVPLALMQKISLSQKLGAGFGFVVLLTLVLGNLGRSSLSSANEAVMEIQLDGDLNAMSQEIGVLMLQHRRFEKDIFLNIGDRQKQVEKYLPSLTAKSEEIRVAFEKLAATVAKDPRRKRDISGKVARLPGLYEKYHSGLMVVTTRATDEEGFTPQGANAAMKPYKESIHRLEQSIDEIAEIASTAFRERVEVASEETSRTSSLLTWGSLGALALGILLAVAITRGITRPLAATIGMLKDIAEGEGDLTKRLDDSRTDELGELATWFNQFVALIQSLIKDIEANSKKLAGSSSELSATSSQLASGAQATTDRSTSVAAAAEEMALNMQGMAKGAEQLLANVDTVASSIQEMNGQAAEVSENARKAAQVAADAAVLAGQSNTNISELGTSADQIGKVIETIQYIAEQTNLLALNATIESARAGEAGKGFAVVANEVKELARQTADATEDIRQRIESIQESTGNAVTSIEKVSQVIAEVNEVSVTIVSAIEHQAKTTKEIAKTVAEASGSARSISIGVSESATAAQEITSNIAGVEASARDASAGATQMQSASTELSSMGIELQRLVGRFNF